MPLEERSNEYEYPTRGDRRGRLRGVPERGPLGNRARATASFPVQLLHAYDPTISETRIGEGFRTSVLGAVHDAARAQLEAARALAVDIQPDLHLTTQLVADSAATALIGASFDAEAVVVGARGASGFSAVVAGSTAMNVATHARCPVVTVPASESAAHAGSGVVVGVDGSAQSDAALGFAFREAADSGGSLTAVLAWTEPLTWSVIAAAMPTPDTTGHLQRAHDQLLAWVQPWGEKYPDVLVHRRVVHELPARALAAASEGAQLVVVGCRGRRAVSSMMLGSVSHGVLHLATCPVAVVHTQS